jgi:hypothetical protein
MASPGFWCFVVITPKRGRKPKPPTDGGPPPETTEPPPLEPGYHAAFIQTALNTSPDHEPEPPETGLPGTWIVVTLMSSTAPVATYAWVPTPSETTDRPEVTPHRSKSKH